MMKINRSLVPALGLAVAGVALAGPVHAAVATPSRGAQAAQPAAAAIPAVQRCSVGIAKGGSVELAVTKLRDRGATADFQVAVTSYALRRVHVDWDKLVDGVGTSFRGVTGYLGVGQTGYFRANNAWEQGAYVTGGFTDSRGNVGQRTCFLNGTAAPVARASAPLSRHLVARPATAAFGGSGTPCRIPLAAGEARITRTTQSIGHREHWTSITLSTTGDGYRLVTNRAIGYGTKGSLVVRGRGFTGDVIQTRSYGIRTKTGRVLASVAVVDLNNGQTGKATC